MALAKLKKSMAELKCHEQSMTTFRDNFNTDHKDTTRYISFDSNNNWTKDVDILNDTTARKITYY